MDKDSAVVYAGAFHNKLKNFLNIVAYRLFSCIFYNVFSSKSFRKKKFKFCLSVFKSTVRIRIRVSKKLRPDPKNILIRIGNTHNFSKRILIKHSITGMTEEEINTFIRRLDKILHKVQDPPIFYLYCYLVQVGICINYYLGLL